MISRQGKGRVLSKEQKIAFMALIMGTVVVEQVGRAVMMESGQELEVREVPVQINLKDAGLNAETNQSIVGTQTLREKVLGEFHGMTKGATGKKLVAAEQALQVAV